jgi:hypothetical protein
MPKTDQKTEVTGNGSKPSQQALQAVDVAVGAVPTVAGAVRNTADTWRKSESRSKELELLRERLGTELEKAEERGGDVRRQVTDQLVGRARKARERVEPVYRDRVEPIYRQHVEPVVRDRVQPIYRDRLEPAVKRVRERI